MKLGGTIQFTPVEIEQLIRKRAVEVAKARGMAGAAADPIDFENRIEVHILGTDDRPNPVGSSLNGVVITWEE